MKQNPSNMFTPDVARFFTRQAGNEGVKMDLYDPVTGKKTEHWVRVVSVDSDIYPRANSKAMRDARLLQDSRLTEDEKIERLEKSKLELVAKLVTEWSLPAECSHENVVEFLTEAPQILEAINQLAGNRPLFMMGSSRSSEPLPEPTSSSAESQKDQEPPNGSN